MRAILTSKLSEQGKDEGCLAVMEDVTPRKLAEQELIGKLVVAGNGKEALEIYERGVTGPLIVLALIVPKMNGKQCFAEILRVNPEARVLVTSGHSVNGQG